MKKWFLLFGCGALLLLSMKGHGIEAGDFGNTPKLVVRGEASIFKPADQMQTTLGIVTEAENSAEALNENNRRMHQIVANLEALGLDESDYQTGRFHIQPIYFKPKDPAEESRSKISHYEVVNTIQIKTQKISLADKIVSAAVEGGANQVDRVNFDLHNPQSYREEAIKLATQNALMDANSLAGAAHVRLVRVLFLSLDQWHNQQSTPLLFARAGGAIETGTPLEAGRVEVQASVHVTFEIAPSR